MEKTPFWKPALWIAALAAVIYSPAMQAPFYLDDADSITGNAAIRDLADWGAIWNFWPPRFLTNLSFALNVRLNGADVFGFHVFNVAVHILCGVLVYKLLFLTLEILQSGRREKGARPDTLAFLGTLLFIAHPLQTQGVTYIVQRAASMAACFYLAALYFFIRWRLSGLRSWLVAALLAAVSAAFTKEIFITLPFMALLYAFYFLPKNSGKKWGTAAFFAVPLVMPLCVLLSRFDLSRIGRGFDPESSVTPVRYFLTQFPVIVTYLRLLFFPLRQNVDYEFPLAFSFWEPRVLGSFFLLAAIAALAVWLFHRQRMILFGIAFFFLALFPESSFLPVADVIFEHRLYLPMVGFVFVAVGVADIFFGRRKKETIAVFSTILLLFSFLTVRRNALWSDPVALWTDTIRQSPTKTRPYSLRGLAHKDAGNWEGAIADWSKAVELNPKDYRGFSNRGAVYQEHGKWDEALADYNEAIRLHPDFAQAYNNRGAIRLARGDWEGAVADLSKSLEIRPSPSVYYNRSLAYLKLGEIAKAEEDRRRFEAYQPK